MFEKTEEIQLDGLAIELDHVGGRHAEDSIVVKILQDGVMFLGDCYYSPPTHLRESDSVPSFDMLERLQSNAYNLYVEGHDKPFTRTELIKILQENNKGHHPNKRALSVVHRKLYGFVGE